MSERLTAEGLDLGVRIWRLEEDLHACQAHTEYLDQRIERLRAVVVGILAGNTPEQAARYQDHAALFDKSERRQEALHQLAEALRALQTGDVEGGGR